MLSPSPHTSAGTYRPDIDGLRAIAIISVVFFHANIPFFTSGFVGVDIFYAISGYLIGGILFRETRAKTFRFSVFYARRARRIHPALIAVVLASTLAATLLLDAGDISKFSPTASAALTGLSNIYFYQYNDYFDQDTSLYPLLMTWSLGVEEQFYAVFPLLILLMASWKKRNTMLGMAAISLISFALCVVMTSITPRAAYYLLPFRAWELGLGALLALYHHTTPHARHRGTELCAIAGLALLVISVTCFDLHTPFPGWVAALPVAGALLLLHTRESTVNRVLLSAPPMVFVGLISYSWYLWHWPLMAYTRSVLTEQPSPGIMIGVTAVSFLIAYLSWRWIEKPFRVARHTPAATLVRYGLILALAVLSCAAILNMHLSHTSVKSRKFQSWHNSEYTIMSLCLGNFYSISPSTSRLCQPPRDGRPAIALFGDSHAAALNAGLKKFADDHNYRLLHFTRKVCPPLLNVGLLYESNMPRATTCGMFTRNALTTIVNDKSIKVVILAGAWSTEPQNIYINTAAPNIGHQLETMPALRKGLPPLFSKLVAANKKIVVVGDVPSFTFTPFRIEGNRAALSEGKWLLNWLRTTFVFTDIGDSSASYKKVTPRHPQVNLYLQQSVKTLPQALFIDLFPQFCDADGCRFKDASGKLMFIDNVHLSRAGSRHINWQELENFLQH